MQKEIKEYTDAIEAHIAATRAELRSRVLVQKTRRRVLEAKQAMRVREMDLLEIEQADVV